MVAEAGRGVRGTGTRRLHMRWGRSLFVNNAADPEELRGLARIGILVVSDRASRGEYDDKSGTAINQFLNKTIRSNWIAIVKIVPDGVDSVAAALVEMSDREGCDLVLTTGGTGPSPRDLTPEATRSIITRELEGFGELMRRVSLEQVPTAILSRQTAGTRGHCLIVNLPGRPSVDRRLPQRRLSGDFLLSRPDRRPSHRGEARCLSCFGRCVHTPEVLFRESFCCRYRLPQRHLSRRCLQRARRAMPRPGMVARRCPATPGRRGRRQTL